MALANFTDLKTSVETWMLRDDARITGTVEDLITLAESRLNRDLDLRVMETDTPLTGTVSSRELTLPADFVAPISLHLTTFGDQRWLRPFVAGAGPNMTYLTYDTIPTAWAINGAKIDLDSPCDQAHTFTFRYRQSFALSDASPTNWLLTNHPDAYLSAVLVEGYALTKSVDKGAIWDQRYRMAVEEIQRKEAKSKSMATLVVDPGLLRTGGFDIDTGRGY